MSAVQTLWARLLARTLADAGVEYVVISPGSRSTPLVAAIAAEPRLHSISVIDERSAGFMALGFGRWNSPVALVCTSGSAAAHYLPAIVEAHLAEVPLIAITADRPPELHDCGASQTMDQTRLYGAFVRGSFDLGAPVGDALAFRAMRAKLAQAIVRSRGPIAGPVHINVPLRKPLEPVEPTSEAEHALAASMLQPIAPSYPMQGASLAAMAELVEAIRAEPNGAFVIGAMPLAFAGAREDLQRLVEKTGYPVLAELGSQVRAGAVAHFDLIAGHAPVPKLIIQLGAEPIAASWPGWAREAKRFVLAQAWNDPTATARVVLGDPGPTIAFLDYELRDLARGGDLRATWEALDRAAAAALAKAMADAPASETTALRAALGAMKQGVLQLGNSLSIRTAEHAVDDFALPVITQRGAAGIDGLIASAAGATRERGPVLLVLGDVSFAHDVGSLQLARHYPVVILVIDNGGGQIFAGLPVASAGLGDAFAKHFTTNPQLDPCIVASAFGIASKRVEAAQVAAAVTEAFAMKTCAVIHVPCSPSGAHDVRRAALAALKEQR